MSCRGSPSCSRSRASGTRCCIPTLFRWHNIVVWQSEKNSPWTAFLVMLHVGSAVGLLIYFWRDWVEIIRAFFRTLAKRRIETPNERLAWLIICRDDPGRRDRPGAPDAVAGRALKAAGRGDLPDGQRLHPALRRAYRRRAEVHELAEREGLNRQGARRLSTLEYREAAVIGVARVGRADRGDLTRRHVHDRAGWPGAGQRRRGPFRVPAGDAADPARGPLQVLGPDSARRAPAIRGAGDPGRGHRGGRVGVRGPLPDPASSRPRRCGRSASTASCFGAFMVVFTLVFGAP